MNDQPSGTVTFLFTDIEGSTRLWEQYPGAMGVALAKHDAILRQVIIEHGGRIFKTVGDKWGIGASLGSLGWIALRQEEYSRANAILGGSLLVRDSIGEKGGMAWCLEKLAESAAASDRPEKAVRLFGAAAALRESIDSIIDPTDQPAYERLLLELEDQLGKTGFSAAWQKGQSTPLEQTILQVTAGDE